MPLSIRPPTSADRPVWETLWAEYQAFYGRSGDTALSPEIIDTAWHRLMDPNEPVFGFLSEREGEVVGLVHFLFHRNMRLIEKSCYLQDLFTAPAARGHGAGRALIEAVAAFCAERGVSDLYWLTHQDNQTARALYDRVANDSGFVVYRMAISP